LAAIDWTYRDDRLKSRRLEKPKTAQRVPDFRVFAKTRRGRVMRAESLADLVCMAEKLKRGKES
jgi:hypothetical protein